MKICRVCNLEKPRAEFYKSASNADGLRGGCKACALKKMADYRALNKDTISATKKRCYWKKREQYLSHNLAYRQANKPKIAQMNALYRQKNKEKVAACFQKWYSRNKKSYRIYARNRLSRKRDNGGSLSPGLMEKLLKLQSGKCACCGEPLGESFHLDHIMPLYLGGKNIDANIQLLRAKCNREKHATHPEDFMRKRGFLL